MKLRVGTVLGLFTLFLSVGCGTEEAPPAETASPHTQAPAAPAAPNLSSDLEAGATTPATWNGKCCTFRCNNGGWWVNATPKYGACIDYARFSCRSNHGSSYDEGSAYWGGC